MRFSSSQRSIHGVALVTILGGCLFLPGCSRTHYRLRADKEVYSLIREKSTNVVWTSSAGFSIDPDPRSRFFDSSSPDNPALPLPGPSLYDYEIPDLSGEAHAGTNQASQLSRDNLRSHDMERSKMRPNTGEASLIGRLPIQPIPKSYWEAIPAQCLARMMEFESVIEENVRQYQTPPEDQGSQGKRLSLRNIVELAQMNSRDYQAQKESLYRAALALTRERYDYSPKFSGNGNGSDASFALNREDGKTAKSSTIGSGVQADKMLTSGGSILARVANDVVITFDGPEGFATDVSSELLFNLVQTVFQRDIRLNPLIQAERDLIYAVRDFARFRKEFFGQLGAEYYGLLQNYRSIEIESQNYFSLVRTFEQAQAEVRAGVINAPNPVAVDQFEQSMLSGRSSLISNCNRLERGFDSMKLALGLPTETPINLNLTELKQLTTLDELEVMAERVRRWRKRVQVSLDQPRPDRNAILNDSIFLTERLLEWLKLRQFLNLEVSDYAPLEESLAQFYVEQARNRAERIESELQMAQTSTSRTPIILLYQQTTDLVDALMSLARVQLELAEKQGHPQTTIADTKAQISELQGQLDSVLEQLGEALQDPQPERLRGLLAEAEALRQKVDERVRRLDQLIETFPAKPEDNAGLAATIERTKRLLQTSDELLQSANTGLLPININMDDAMATALVQRLDLMNQRGRLADDWRAIKLTADDLKSVLNLNVSQSIRTSDDKALDFSLDNSQTRVGLSFDLPLNRIEQRNSFRRAMIGYQNARRNLMALEDSIKFDVRNSLRTLAETRLQYPISVTRAALAAEQVTSIRLQLALGVTGVRGTDLLDALQDSREALIAVANSRIGYIVDDALFAIDLELMELDQSGYWPHINDPDFQPVRNLVYPKHAGPTYGAIPPYLRVSEQMKQISRQPLPGERPAAVKAQQPGEGS